jgi:hypothetical protein
VRPGLALEGHRRAQERLGLRTALGPGQPCRGGQALDLDLVDPPLELGVRQGLPELRQARHGLRGARDVPAAGGSHGARELGQRQGERVGADHRGMQDRQLGRLVPAAPLQGQTRRDRPDGVGSCEVRFLEVLDTSQVLEDLDGLGVLRRLQVGEDQVIEGVELVVPDGAAVIAGRVLARGGRRGQVGFDRFRPHAEARVDVRRHVERMRYVGRDAAVLLGGGQAAGRERRVVVGVDDVVRDARVGPVLLEERLEDRRRLELVRVREIRRRRRPEQRQGAEQGHLQIGGVALLELLELLPEGQRPRSVRPGSVARLRHAAGLLELVGGPEVGVDGRDQAALEVGSRAERLRHRDGLDPGLHFRGGRRLPQGVVVGHGDAPPGHRALRVALRDLQEAPPSLLVEERVQQAQGLLEVPVHLGQAGDLEVHRAVPGTFRAVCRLVRSRCIRRGTAQQQRS